MQTLGPEEGSGPPRERRPGGSWTKVHRTPTTCFLWYLPRWFGHRLFERKRKEKKITEYSVQNKRPDHSLRAEMALASSTEAAPNMSPHTEYSIVLPIRVCYNGAPPYSNLQSCTPDCRLPFLHFSLTFSLPLSLSLFLLFLGEKGDPSNKIFDPVPTSQRNRRGRYKSPSILNPEATDTVPASHTKPPPRDLASFVCHPCFPRLC